MTALDQFTLEHVRLQAGPIPARARAVSALGRINPPHRGIVTQANQFRSAKESARFNVGQATLSNIREVS